MAEQVYDDDEDGNARQSALSGELGSPSATWIRWLASMNSADTDWEASAAPLPSEGSSAPIGFPFPGWEPLGLWKTLPDEVEEDIEEQSTTPLELSPESSYAATPPPFPAAQPSSFARATPEPPPSSLFEQRYAEGAAFAYVHADLQNRRADDERLTGRRWPGSDIPHPRNAHEAMIFDQLALALGEVNPRVFARESALRYVQASRLPEEDELAPTDVYAIFYYGLGLTLRPLDCVGLPHVLATYHRRLHEVYLDWALLQDPPYGRATLDQTAWRRAVDSSQLARLLVAWCVATHLSENYDVPLVLGFSLPAPEPAHTGSLTSSGAASILPAGSSADLLNRYRKTMIAFATLLAPQERLWQQISTLQLGIHMGDAEWRAHLGGTRAGGWREVKTSGRRPPLGIWYPRDVDPVAQVLRVLAELNNCPPSLIEWQLDGKMGVLDWDAWSTRLLGEVPALQQRYAAALQLLYGEARARVRSRWPLAAGREPEKPSPRLWLTL